MLKFGADWAYTMDGSQVGELEKTSMRLKPKSLSKVKVYIRLRQEND
jgi:di/tripeptidase